ncbi:FtsQ-type POTRA domain-containing protein [Wukongibacter baidiensis]|uniref:cell division protein FtsQ/DivIB n=1 Tax=Wukongibacter baidiensis TaxID=1723361 RepID=UPI003D7F9574
MVTRKHRVDKKVRYGKIKIYLLIFFLLSTLIFIILFKTNYFEISDIIVKNNIEISNEEIVAYSGVRIGDNTFKLKTSEIREKIIKTPFIKDVTIKRKLPNKLMVEVVERQKIAAISYMGLYFFVDNEGVILYTSHEIDDTYVIEGFEFESFTEGEKIKVKSDEDLKRAIALCGLLESSELPIKPKIACVEGEFILYLNDNFKIKLGRGENLERRFAIFKAIYRDLTSKNVDSGVVDISHDGYPTYSPFGE